MYEEDTGLFRFAIDCPLLTPQLSPNQRFNAYQRALLYFFMSPDSQVSAFSAVSIDLQALSSKGVNLFA